jgi:RNA recognition motif 2
LAVWNDIPHALMHRDIRYRPYMAMGTRSYSPQYPSYPPNGYLETRDHWASKSKTFSSEAESSTKVDEEIPHRHIPNHHFHLYESNVGKPYFEMYPRSQRKWSDDDLENYFTQMRISPRDIDPTIIRPLPMRPYRYDESPTGTSNETEESISGESMGTSSNNTFINGSVGLVPERNKVILEKIKRGVDTRTTIMIKNVPNKYTQVIPFERILIKQMLMEYVDITNSGTYDFLYLRIDFQNKCKFILTLDTINN